MGSVKIDSFQVLDAGINYAPDKSTVLKIKINNLTNERYEQISGYPGLCSPNALVFNLES